MAECEPIRGDKAVKILETRKVSTEFLLVDANELASALSPWFIRKEDKEKIVAPLLQTGDKKSAASKLLDVIVEHFQQGRMDVSLQDLITTLLKTKKYINLITALVDACFLSQESAIDERRKRIVHNLAEYYKHRFGQYSPYPLADSFSISTVWVNLSLSKGRSKLFGDYIAMLKEAYKGPQISLMIGHPGQGKTMAMRRVAFDWATGMLKDYDLVLAVPLREVQEKSKTILDMALSYVAKKNVLKEPEVSYLRQCSMVGEPKEGEEPVNQLHVLIILDGYDELSSKAQCNELSELLSSPVLPNLDYCVLLTSRPYAVENVHAPISILKIEPLSVAQQRTYILQHFIYESYDNRLERFKKLAHLLSQSPTLGELAKIPLMLCFICILGNKLKPKDDSIQLHKLLCNAMVERYESKVSSKMGEEGEQFENRMAGIFYQPFDNICGQSQLLYNLSRMALDGLIGDFQNAPDKLQFTADDIKKYEVDGSYCAKVGFLNVLLDEGMYEFPHKTMQEFIAALLLFHELSKCKEIVIYHEDKEGSTCPKIKSIDRRFQRRPLLKQVLNTTKHEELNQLFCFLLEMSAEHYKNNDRPFPAGSQEAQRKRVSNTIHFFIAWIGRDEMKLGVNAMFRPLLKHLSNCSEVAKNYLRYKLLVVCRTGEYDPTSLLCNFSTWNVAMFRVDPDCIYIPDLQIIFIVDQTSTDRTALSHAIPISYERLKAKCESTFKLCFVDSASLQNLHKVCRAIECKKIDTVTITISSAINQSSSLSLEQKIHVKRVIIKCDETNENPIDLAPVWNRCISSFTNMTRIEFGSLTRNNTQVIGIDKILGQTNVRNSIETIYLTCITFPNEETVRLLAEQLKLLKSLRMFNIFTCDSQSIGERCLFMLLDSVNQDGGSYPNILWITEFCLQQRETFKELCSRLEQWDHLRVVRLNGFLSSDIDLLCNTVSKLSHLEILHISGVNQEDVNRLKEANPNLKLISHNYQ